MYHKPALLTESIEGLSVRPGGTYVDVTFGGGGHSKAILSLLGPGRLLAFDQDEDALSNTIDDSRFTLINSNFRYLKHFLRYHNAIPVDGILADLGISSHQIDTASRGFSTRYDAPLDMRMSRNLNLTAADLLNTLPEDRLATLFRLYGEIENAGKLASRIVHARSEHAIRTVEEFKKIMGNCIPKNSENKYLAMVFQALRIEVNHEMESLKEMLVQSREVLTDGGRLAIISYHSLEDRLVKNYLKSGNFEGSVEKDFYGKPSHPFHLVVKKPITPSAEETAENPRSRSAKLRIGEKKP